MRYTLYKSNSKKNYKKINSQKNKKYFKFWELFETWNCYSNI